MKFPELILNRNKYAMKKAGGLTTGPIFVNEQNGASMPFTDKQTNESYIIVVYPITSTVVVGQKLMCEDLLEKGGIEG